MKYSLDTHIFLWFISGDSRLSKSAQKEIRNTQNQIYLSVISVWEAIVKYKLGKLPLPETPEIYLPKQRERHLISGLDLDEKSVRFLSQLPNHHRDPFDRILVCQAMRYEMKLISIDEQIKKYPISVL